MSSITTRGRYRGCLVGLYALIVAWEMHSGTRPVIIDTQGG